MKISDSLHWAYFLLVPWIGILLLRGSGLIGFSPISVELWLFLGCFVIFSISALTLGIFAGRSVRTVLGKRQPLAAYGDLLLLVGLTAVYISTLSFDFFVTKGGTLSTITSIREQDNLAGPRMSMLGGVIALTSAAPYMLLGFLIFSLETGRRVAAKYFAVLAVFGIAVSFLTGGRNPFLIGMTVVTVQYVLTRGKLSGFRLSGYGRVALYLFLASCVAYSLYIFLERELNQGVSSSDLIWNFSQKWDVPIKEYDFGFAPADNLYSTLLILLFYFAHPLSYLDDYFTSMTSPIFMGAYNFPVVAKALEVLLGNSAYSNLEVGLLLPGVYLTLPGSLYLDFGYFGGLFTASGLGLLTGVLYACRNQLGFAAKLFLSLLIATWLLSPLYSVFGISNGFSFIVILALLQGRRFILTAVKQPIRSRWLKCADEDHDTQKIKR